MAYNVTFASITYLLRHEGARDPEATQFIQPESFSVLTENDFTINALHKNQGVFILCRHVRFGL